MCTGRMPPHHMLFFYKAGKLVILTPAYSTEVTFLQCGFPLPARKLFFSACTEGSRWGHDIHIHQPRSATLTLTPDPHQCSLHGLNRRNLGLLQDPQNMFIISKAGKHEEVSRPNNPPTISTQNLHYDALILKQVSQEWNICPTNRAFLKLCG